jgi:hypothetical protein
VPFASTSPDGLERVALSLGVKSPPAIWPGLLADYTLPFPFLHDSWLAKLLAGLAGIVLVLSLGWVVGWSRTHDEERQKDGDGMAKQRSSWRASQLHQGRSKFARGAVDAI